MSPLTGLEVDIMKLAPHVIAPERVQPSAPPSRRGAFRALQTAAALVFVAGVGLVASTSSSGCGTFCDGGFIRKGTNGAEDTCEGMCEASKCGADGACVDNHCALTCATHRDCAPNTEDCVPAKDDSGKAIDICQPTGKALIGADCPFGTECGGLFACPDGKACDPACTGADCPCPADKCLALACLGNGLGDADAFCTLNDCHADTDCPGGYWCGPVRTTDSICGPTCSNGKCSGGASAGATCKIDADCQKGGCGADVACSSTKPCPSGQECGADKKCHAPCVDPAQNAATGATWTEGAYCAFRNQCRLRKPCSPCETDLDCSAIPGQHCTTMPKDGTKACTRDCGSDTDCQSGFQCTSGACVPRFGSCVGDKNFCEPCRSDADCGTGLGCTSLGGDERICVDFSFSKSCTSDASCPASPDGRHGICADDRIQSSPGDGIYHHCGYPPYNEASSRFSCWRGNPGSACKTNNDCISKTCTDGVCG